MDRYYFIEVQAYKSVNNMGLELGQYVYDRFNWMAVHEGCIDDIVNEIKEKMEELEGKYPKCRPFKFNQRIYTDLYHETEYDISAKPDSQYNDNYIFILRTTLIRKMNLELTLNI